MKEAENVFLAHCWGGGGLGLGGFQVSRVTFLLASCEPDLGITHPPGSVGYGLIEMVLVCNYGNSNCLIKVRLAVQTPLPLRSGKHGKTKN